MYAALIPLCARLCRILKYLVSLQKPEKSQADCETVQILLVFAVWGLVSKDISVIRLQKKSLCTLDKKRRLRYHKIV